MLLYKNRRVQNMPVQIADKASKHKNPNRTIQTGWHFCLLRQLRLQIQLHTSVYAPSFAVLFPCLERTETEAH